MQRNLAEPGFVALYRFGASLGWWQRLLNKAREKKTWRQRAQELKRESIALYLAYRDPRVPLYAKVWIALVIAYAFSPIDLIPDFIPVLGYLDDLVLIPAGVALALRMVPPEVMADCRARAAHMTKPVSQWGAIIIVGLWITGIGAALWLLWLR